MIITKEIIGIIKNKIPSEKTIMGDPSFYIGYKSALIEVLIEVRKMDNNLEALNMFGKLMGDINNEV